MNTPAHLIIGAAAFGQPNARAVTWAAIVGGFLPDLSLYLLAGVSIFVLGISPGRVFDELYFSDTWQQIFAVDNSFILWGIAFGLAIWRRVPWAVALCGAALLHLALDFPLHNDDARMHFWPLTDWKFISPISYWEGARGGDIVNAIELALVAVLTVCLFRRFRDWGFRAVFAALAAMELVPGIMFRLMF